MTLGLEIEAGPGGAPAPAPVEAGVEGEGPDKDEKFKGVPGVAIGVVVVLNGDPRDDEGREGTGIGGIGAGFVG